MVAGKLLETWRYAEPAHRSQQRFLVTEQAPSEQ